MADPFSSGDQLKKHSGDTDLSWDALHHTVGKGPTQAAPGNHKHNASDIEGYEGGEVPPAFEPWYRRTDTYTIPVSSTLAPGATWVGSLGLTKAYRLYMATASAPCRVRLYASMGQLTSDASRPIGTDPVGNHGLIFEFVFTSTLLSAVLSPMVDGFKYNPVEDWIPVALTNTGATALSFNLTLLWIRTE